MPPDGTAAEQNASPSNPQSNQRFSLTRVHTGQYPDAASVYHPEGEREQLAKAEASSSDEDFAQVDAEGDKEVEEIPEVRDGIPDDRDVEKGDDAALEKKKTSRSARSARTAADPNEVRQRRSFNNCLRTSTFMI